MAETESKTKSFLKPVVGGVVLIGAVVAIIAFRNQLGDAIASGSREGGKTIVDWVPDHPSETIAIVVGFLVAFGINWIAHVVGRLRAWIFAIVVEAGLWLLFWNSVGIPSLKELMGIGDDVALTGNEQVITGLIIILLSGAIFWILEMRENWAKYRRKHNEEG